MEEILGVDIPLLVGTINQPQGIRGFKPVEIGHPVFELKDRYLIYMESDSPLVLKREGQPLEIKEFKVAIPYYKSTLSPFINFKET